VFADIFDLIIMRYHQRRGLKALHISNFPKATYHFEKALLRSTDHINYFYLAVALIGQHKHQRAVVFLEKIIDDHCEDILISSTLAECYLVLREWEKAERLLNFLYGKFPQNTTIKYLHLLVNDSILRDKYACGKELFFQSVESLERREITQAILHIEKAIELNETNSAYYFFAGYLLMQAKKERAEVEKYIEKAVQLAPHNESYKRHLRYVKTKY